MNIVKENKIKQKISKISSKNNLFNSFKQKTYFKEYAVNQKMYLKNNKINNNLNDNKAIKANFPIDLLNNNNKSNTRYIKYYNKNKNNNNINKKKYADNYLNNNNNKNIKYSKKVYTKGNNISNSKSNLINNNNSKNRKTISSFTNPNINTSLGYINASKINKVNKITQSVNPINTYIINTLNVSEKEFLKTGITNSKQQKVPYEQGIDYQNEINKLIKEKEEDKSTIKKQKKLIEQFLLTLSIVLDFPNNF